MRTKTEWQPITSAGIRNISEAFRLIAERYEKIAESMDQRKVSEFPMSGKKTLNLAFKNARAAATNAMNCYEDFLVSASISLIDASSAPDIASPAELQAKLGIPPGTKKEKAIHSPANKTKKKMAKHDG